MAAVRTPPRTVHPSCSRAHPAHPPNHPSTAPPFTHLPGACIKTYYVDVTEVDRGMLRSAPQPRRTQAPDVTVTINEVRRGA